MKTSLAAMAWRNLWRHRRRTLITLTSIGLGVFFAVIFTAIGDRTYGDMIDLAARNGAGHVTFQHREYNDTPTLSRSVSGAEALLTLAREDPDVVRAVPRVMGNLMIATARKNIGARFIAFDPAREDTTTLSLLDAIVEGGVAGPTGRPGIVLGAKLAENLGTRVGHRVVYTVTDKHGDLVQEAVRVTGVLRTGIEGLDAGLALLPLATFQATLGYAKDEVGQVAIFLLDQRRAHAVALRLSAAIRSPVAVVTWDERSPELAGFIAMKQGGARVMELIILLLVAAGIFNTLFMSVMERVREFGVLLAIGLSPGRLFGIVMLESIWLALIGLAAGAAISAGPYTFLAKVGIDVAALAGGQGQMEVAGVGMDAIRAGLYPESAALIAALTIVTTLLAGLYPALNAGRIDPVDAIRVL